MAIIGSIIKGIIELADTVTTEENPVDAQHNVLMKLLDTAKNTRFGMDYGFAEILKHENPEQVFARNIPFFDYNQMQEQYWKHLHEGKMDISWPGNPEYYALSSGTTGKTSKRIPITNEMLEAIKKTGIKQVASLANFDLPAEFFEKTIMMLGSSTNLVHKNGHLEGEISGISASNIPFWFRGYYKPGEEISKIDNWDERVQKIAEEAPNWDIGALSGIPSWMELMLKKVIAHNKVEDIHDIWPNLQVYASGGVAFGPYKKSFNALLKHPITIIDTYLASEGFLAYQDRPNTNAMKLVLDNGIYFEFVPFKPEYIHPDGSIVANAPSLTISDVKEGVEYILILSSVSGAWRYLIGDTIKFTNVSRAEISITGRTKFFLNVVGSQLSVNKMNDAIQKIEKEFNTEIPEFTIAAIKFNGEFYHKWYIGTPTPNIDEEKIAKALDEALKKANKNYKVARSKALKGVKLVAVPPAVFHDWNEHNKKKGGQVKMERVMDKDKFKEWEEFVGKKG
ncbi:GH3 family domain-containing protein [Galbibacter pacificus]|uniref:GH3 auxin-responsive promoter family protein n=1 Tax=Galbibacter pacificus TaxID=2996052 RepID=A0ABT6FVK0_9FLAO|nr:GH3 auxin-responsive promoter family protein [Galbibacter pacificus]MDG3583797.1 GH3 auxin-responsive promoter family protein [Galbibacter pacificus]MDG3587285.1 GH3 auxin-responsive promoter family protein [Galbibacter pacificus]